MIIRLKPDKDTFIAKEKTSANFGSCEILDLYKKVANSFLTRILLHYDLSLITQTIAKATLILKNIVTTYEDRKSVV